MGSTGKSSACSICGALVAPRSDNPAFPFCSERCRTIDLGHWLDERYRIPTRESPDEHATDDDDSSN
jgi:endogenous inhibitor of DNA gyrase (YacG/DUF329 family)